MNSNQRSEGNNQSNNGANELDMNSARAGTADRDNLAPATRRSGELGSEQSGKPAGNQQAGQFAQGGQGQGSVQSGSPQSGSQQSGGQQSGSPGSDRNPAIHGGTYQETGTQPSGAHQPGYQNADRGNEQSGQRDMSSNRDSLPGGSKQSTDRSGSQTGNTAANAPRQGGTDDRQSNDAAGSYPMSPGGSRQSADQKMDDDTGLSNTANRQVPDLDPRERQEQQSNVGRRSDGTPD